MNYIKQVKREIKMVRAEIDCAVDYVDVESREQTVTTPALVFHGEGDLRYEPKHKLAAPGEDDPRYEALDILRAAICGSDSLILAGKHPYGEPPFILGHEGVYKDKGGNIVVARTTYDSCLVREGKLTHPLCQRAGDDFLCPDKVVYGIGGPNGVFAQKVVVPRVSEIKAPEELYWDLGQEIVLERLVQAEPAAVAYTALSRAGFKPGQAIFIEGITGNLGALLALEAEHMGASWVGGTCTRRGMGSGRAGLLQALGVDEICLADKLDIQPPPISVYVDATPVGGASILHPEVKSQVEKGARIILAGVYPKDQPVPVDMQTIVFKGWVFIGAISSTREAWEWVVREFLPETPVEMLVTAVFPMTDFERAFDHAQSYGGKVLLDPSY